MEAVNIETVKEIIEKIGNATDIDDEANTESRENTTEDTDNATGIAEGENVEDRKKPEDQERQNDFFNRLRDRVRNKRLYRNTDDKMIGGVCSGLGFYLGADPVLVRVLFLIALLFGTLGFWVYLIIWIVAPLAVNPVQKCEMRGLAPTAENLGKFSNKSK